MSTDLKISREMIVSAISGMLIVDSLDGWSFRLDEVAPYIFKAYGEHVNHETVNGYGKDAEEALMACVRKVEK